MASILRWLLTEVNLDTVGSKETEEISGASVIYPLPKSSQGAFIAEHRNLLVSPA